MELSPDAPPSITVPETIHSGKGAVVTAEVEEAIMIVPIHHIKAITLHIMVLVAAVVPTIVIITTISAMEGLVIKV